MPQRKAARAGYAGRRSPEGGSPRALLSSREMAATLAVPNFASSPDSNWTPEPEGQQLTGNGPAAISGVQRDTDLVWPGNAFHGESTEVTQSYSMKHGHRCPIFI